MKMGHKGRSRKQNPNVPIVAFVPEYPPLIKCSKILGVDTSNPLIDNPIIQILLKNYSGLSKYDEKQPDIITENCKIEMTFLYLIK